MKQNTIITIGRQFGSGGREVAKTIAEKINGAISVDIPDTQIQLLINGSGGNEWIISRY